MSEKRFKDVLDRLQGIRHAFVVCEFPLTDIINFPENSGIPDWTLKRLKMTPGYLLKYVTDITVKYGIPVYFCDNARSAETLSESLIKRVLEFYEQEKK